MKLLSLNNKLVVANGKMVASTTVSGKVFQVDNKVASANGKVVTMGNYVADFPTMKAKLLSLGETTGTDANGDYVTITANKAYGTILFEDIFEENTRYVLYFRGVNTNTSNPKVTNLRVNYTNDTFSYIDAATVEGGTFTTSPTRSVASIEKVWATAILHLYDFYIIKA